MHADTTRSPRAGETNGKDYHFVTRPQFEDLIAKVSLSLCSFLLKKSSLTYQQNSFIEHAQFSGNYYGTSSQAVQDVGESGKRCILDIDSQGVKLVKTNHPSLNCVFVFLCPPSLDDLKSRLRGRGTESEESMQKRLEASQAEIAYAKEGVYDVVIVNDDVEAAYTKLKAVTTEDRLDVGDVLPASL